jgi:hypothetical protein
MTEPCRATAGDRRERRGGSRCLVHDLTIRHEGAKPWQQCVLTRSTTAERLRVPSNPDDPITFTCALEARHETVYFLAKLIHEHCERSGTRRGTRALGPFRHAVMVLRWFLDSTRVRQLAADNHIGKTTCYDRLHEAIDLLAALAPDVHDAILAASAAGATHLNLDGTLIHTDRVAMKDPNDADLWWSGKHRHHGGNVQVLADPAGFPIWVSGVRPGREHDTTCAKAALVLLHLEHDRPLPGGYAKLRLVTRKSSNTAHEPPLGAARVSCSVIANTTQNNQSAS